MMLLDHYMTYTKLWRVRLLTMMLCECHHWVLVAVMTILIMTTPRTGWFSKIRSWSSHYQIEVAGHDIIFIYINQLETFIRFDPVHIIDVDRWWSWFGKWQSHTLSVISQWEWATFNHPLTSSFSCRLGLLKQKMAAVPSGGAWFIIPISTPRRHLYHFSPP